MGSTYHHDYSAFGVHVLRSPWMLAEMGRRAEKVKARAEATAPYDPDDPDGTHYKDSFDAEALIEGDRARGRVRNTDLPTAIFVEFGANHTPRYRTLGNALDAAKD